jgi:hypothetical protein
MTTPDQREWLALLEAERARRIARVAWEADDGERQRQQLLDELEAMAERLAAPLPMHPFDLNDMSPAEKLALHLLP